jgi:hypothetical protein
MSDVHGPKAMTYLYLAKRRSKGRSLKIQAGESQSTVLAFSHLISSLELDPDGDWSVNACQNTRTLARFPSAFTQCL